MEGALADVQAQFVDALKRRGNGGEAVAAAGGAEAFYEANVAPVRECVRECGNAWEGVCLWLG